MAQPTPAFKAGRLRVTKDETLPRTGLGCGAPWGPHGDEQNRLSVYCVGFTQTCVRFTFDCVALAQCCAYHAQMISARVTFGDLAAVGQVDRHRLRNLLKGMPEFATRPANERVASEYTRHDLTVVAVLCELERMGFRKDAIAGWVTPIQQALLGPRSMAAPQLFLACEPATASLVDGKSPLGAGVLIDLDKILTLVESHCSGTDGGREPQRELEFGPTSVGRPTLSAMSKVRSHG